MQNAELIYIAHRIRSVKCPEPVLEIGAGWTPELHRKPFISAGFKEFLTQDFVNHPGMNHDFVGDICAKTTIPDATAGTVLLFNVLEHVYAPWLAVDEIFRTLKPGGVLIGSVPLRTSIHRWDKDYWRFCPDGVAYLFRRFRLVNLALDGNVAFPANLMFTCVKEGKEDWAEENQDTALRPEVIMGNDYLTPSLWKKFVVDSLRRRFGMTLDHWDGPWNETRMKELGFKSWTTVDYKAEAKAMGIKLQ